MIDRKWNIWCIIFGLLIAYFSFRQAVGVNATLGLLVVLAGLFIACYGAVNYSSWKGWLKILLAIIFAVVSLGIFFGIYLFIVLSNPSGLPFG